MVNNEYWKDIKDYEELYQVSNLGRIKSLSRIDSLGRLKKEKILKPIKNDKYFRITLYKDGIGKNYLIHRLVAECFIENVDNLKCVNHKDENTYNNVLENLEWCTYEYNNSYGTRIDRVREKCINGKRSVSVIAISLVDGEIFEFSSMSEAERITGVKSGNISNCCSKKQKSAGNFIWKINNEIKYMEV